MRHKDISIERHPCDGFTLYAMHEGYLVHRRYIYYTEREARRMFREEFS